MDAQGLDRDRKGPFEGLAAPGPAANMPSTPRETRRVQPHTTDQKSGCHRSSPGPTFYQRGTLKLLVPAERVGRTRTILKARSVGTSGSKRTSVQT